MPAIVSMSDEDLKRGSAERQTIAAAILLAGMGEPLTTRKLAYLTGCSLRTAQLHVKKAGTIDLTPPATRYVDLAADDMIWRLSPRDWAVMVSIRYLTGASQSWATSHTTETIARYAGIPTHAATEAIASLKSSGHITSRTTFCHDIGKRRRTITPTATRPLPPRQPEKLSLNPVGESWIMVVTCQPCWPDAPPNNVWCR